MWPCLPFSSIWVLTSMAQQQWCPPKRGGRVDFNPLSQAHCCDYFMVTVVNSYFCDLNSVPFRPVFLQNTDQHAAARVGGRRGIGNEVCDLHFVCNHQHEAVAANGLNSDRRTSPQCLSGPEHVQLLVDYDKERHSESSSRPFISQDPIAGLSSSQQHHSSNHVLPAKQCRV